jgi:hypothetical protein
VRFVHQRVGCVRKQQRNGDHAHVPEGDPVVFVGLLLSLGKLVLVFENNNVGQDASEAGVWSRLADANVDSLGDLPCLNCDTHALAEQDHPRGVLVVVHQIKEDDELHNNVCKDGAHRNTNVVLLLAPMANIALESQKLEDHV